MGRLLPVCVMMVSCLSAACESGAGGGAPDTSAVADAVSGDTGASPAELMCQRWNSDRADLREGHWTGQVSGCESGTLEQPGPDNTLKQVNLYRWMAGLPSVTWSDDKNAAAQACALIMHANGALTHQVPASWECVSAAGSRGAERSNIASVPAVAAVDLYMIDAGIPSLGHRRWILSDTLGPIGVGSTSAFSCLHVIGGQGSLASRWTAWPPPGPFPLEALAQGGALDRAGWSIQSDTMSLVGAEVTISVDGQSMPIIVDDQLDTGFGSTFAISMRPDGWRTEAGSTYRVEVRGLLEDIDYDVEVVQCSP